MTKKHFELLAKNIRQILDSHARLQAAVAVGSACIDINPRFDITRFYQACGIE